MNALFLYTVKGLFQRKAEDVRRISLLDIWDKAGLWKLSDGDRVGGLNIRETSSTLNASEKSAEEDSIESEVSWQL